MQPSPRDALNSLLLAALVTVGASAGLVPHPLSATERVSFLRLPLADGTSLEFTERVVYHLARGPKPKDLPRTPVRNGDFSLKNGRRVVMKDGALEIFDTGDAGLSIELKEQTVDKEQRDVGDSKSPGPSWIVRNKLTGESVEYKPR